MKLVKFSEMKYERPDIEKLKTEFAALTDEFIHAETYDQAKALFLKEQELEKHLISQETIAEIRHSIDTTNEFYDQEEKFWNQTEPELREYLQKWKQAVFTCPFRAEFSDEYGEIIFLNAEIELKAFSPEIIPEMQQEAELRTEYNKLIASAQIPFQDGVFTISQLSPYKNDPDDEIRLQAWKAEGGWYKDNQPELDRIYDELTHLRDRMGRKMGYDGYTKLGYYRMGRNCYTKEDVDQFRAAVRKYLVPIAERIYKDQAERLKMPYPLSFSDAQLEYRSGNPKPQGSAEDILAAGDRFYNELSEETGEFFRTMRQYGLMDVLSTKGKQAGGYCTGIPDYEVPFIFANFNGTQHDVEVVTHEAGHAFEYYMNRKRIPIDCIWPGMESCEVHSMSMEFFAWPWAESFFGKDTKKFLYSHLASALTFIPYGTMVDHFQHVVYEKPKMSPKERHQVWKDLLEIYMPWLRLDGEIPFYSDGEGWQRQQHIYNNPFYYIDYCLAQTVALEFWSLIQEDQNKAWEKYMAYTLQGGSRTFIDLLKNAGLENPFDENCLKEITSKAKTWLDEYDRSDLV